MNARVKAWLFSLAISFVFLININKVFAEEGCIIQKTQNILDCALAKHPDVVNAELEKDRDQKLVEIAKQRPNPEIETRILGGPSADDTSFNTENSLLFTLELGRKRKARMKQANQQAQKKSVQVLENKETIALQTVLSLYRLREIQSELARVNETITTFDKLLKALKLRPTLTPEQEVSFASFHFAREEYKLKKTSLVQEQSKLSYSLELSIGVPFAKLKKYLPPPKKQWPKLSIASDLENSASAVLAKAKADQQINHANVEVAKSRAWPDLKIGPTFDTESLTDSNQTKVIGGLGFSLPLPILNRNQGEKAYAYADKLRAETNLQITLRKTAIERQSQQQRYLFAVQALKQSETSSSLHAQHENIEGFFEKGLIPSTLVIETHRQLYEITKTRNEQELAAIDALWRIYIIDGKVFEAKL